MRLRILVLAAVLLVAAVLSPASAPAGHNGPLAGQWHLETADHTTPDSSGHGLTGTTGGGLEGTAGRFGSGLLFDSTSFVNVASSPLLEPTHVTPGGLGALRRVAGRHPQHRHEGRRPRLHGLVVRARHRSRRNRVLRARPGRQRAVLLPRGARGHRVGRRMAWGRGRVRRHDRPPVRRRPAGRRRRARPGLHRLHPRRAEADDGPVRGLHRLRVRRATRRGAGLRPRPQRERDRRAARPRRDIAAYDRPEPAAAVAAEAEAARRRLRARRPRRSSPSRPAPPRWRGRSS